MSSARIRVGLVGLDHWYTAIPLAEEIAKSAETTLVGIYDADGVRARQRWPSAAGWTGWRPSGELWLKTTVLTQ